MLKTFENRIERGFPYDHLRMPTSALATAIHTCICMHIYIYICISYIPADWTLEPDFGNLPYPEKVTGTNRSDLGKIDKIYNIFTFCETVHRNQNLEPLPKMARREPKMTTLSQFFTRKVTVKLAK